MELTVGRNILEANDRLAEENQNIFKKNNVLVINLMSSPGAGKTSLLERTIEALKERINIAVIEGDIQSARDAERIAQKGVQAIQINTDGACHLDADMIRQGRPKTWIWPRWICWWSKTWATWSARRNSTWERISRP